MRAASAFFLASWVFVGAVRAEPTIDVRARATLELHPSRTDDGRVRIRVVLTDDVGAEIPSARVALTLRSGGSPCGAPIACTTDRTGTCEVESSACAADEIEGEYEGSASMDGHRIRVPVIDHGAQPRVTVSLEGGRVLDLDAPRARITASVDGIASMPARVLIADELGRVVLHRALDARATVELSLAPNDLGPPGLGAVVATFRFEDGSEASGRTMIARRVHARLSLRRVDDRLVARLSDRAGPVVGAIVSLVANGARVADARTDAIGDASFAVGESDDARRVVARFHSNDPGRSDAESAALVLPGTGASRYLVVLPLATLGVLVVSAWLLRRRVASEVVDASPRKPEPPVVETSTSHGIFPTETSVGIRVRAREADHAIPGARVRLEDGPPFPVDGEHHRLASHPSGTFTLVVEAPGRAPEQVRIRIPHRGEWSDAIVRLETTRAHARRAIELVAIAAALDPDEAETLTVREADARLLPGSDPSFRADAEDSVYAPEDPTLEGAVGLVERGRARAEREKRT